MPKNSTIIREHNIQSREPWELRAIKLQLLHPNYYHTVCTLLMSQQSQRNYTGSVFGEMQRDGILRQIEFGAITPYRQQLLIKACRAHNRIMRRQEQNRGREQSAQDQQTA